MRGSWLRNESSWIASDISCIILNCCGDSIDSIFVIISSTLFSTYFVAKFPLLDLLISLERSDMVSNISHFAKLVKSIVVFLAVLHLSRDLASRHFAKLFRGFDGCLSVGSLYLSGMTYSSRISIFDVISERILSLGSKFDCLWLDLFIVFLLFALRRLFRVLFTTVDRSPFSKNSYYLAGLLKCPFSVTTRLTLLCLFESAVLLPKYLRSPC